MLLKSFLLVTTLAVSFSTADDPQIYSRVAQGTVTKTVTASAVPTDRPNLCSSLDDLCHSMTGLPRPLCDSIAGACPSCSDSNGTFWKTFYCIEDTLAPKFNVSAIINLDRDTISSPNCTAVKDICYSVPDASFDGPQSFVCNKMFTNCLECSSKGSNLNDFGDCFKLPSISPWEVVIRSSALVDNHLVERDYDPTSDPTSPEYAPETPKKGDAPETPKQEDAPEAPEVVDPDTNSINSFNGIHNSDPESTVNCKLAAYTCNNNPLMDNERCLSMVNECYRCAQLEEYGCDSDAGDDERADEFNGVMCSVATAQRCYNAAFNFGTLITSNVTLGYGCEQAKQTCDQHVHNFHAYHEISKSAFDPECQHQYDACLSCRIQEHACRSGPSDGRPDKDNAVVASKSFCSAQAASCFSNAMTSNGTWEHPVNVTNSEVVGHFTDYFTDYLTDYFTDFEDEGESNNSITVTTAIVTVTGHA